MKNLQRLKLAALLAAIAVLSLPAVAEPSVHKANIEIAPGLPNRMTSTHVLAARVELFHKDQLGHWVKVRSFIRYDSFVGLVTVFDQRSRKEIEYHQGDWRVEWARTIHTERD